MGNGSVLHGRVLHPTRIDYDERENFLVARLLGLRDIAGLHAYNRSARGSKLMWRIRPDVGGAAHIAAQTAGTGLNEAMTEPLRLLTADALLVRYGVMVASV
jgi:hypothetical protein